MVTDLCPVIKIYYRAYPKILIASHGKESPLRILEQIVNSLAIISPSKFKKGHQMPAVGNKVPDEQKSAEHFAFASPRSVKRGK
jgi:hypothetical protein